jgi:DNA-binding CsgD family transcriptional regulator
MDCAISAALSSSLDRAPGICACKDEDSRFLYANQAFKRLVGFASDEDVRGLTDFDLPCEVASDAEVFQQQDTYILKHQIAITTLNVHRFDARRSRAFVVSKKPFVDHEAGVRGVMFTGTELNLNQDGAREPDTVGLMSKLASLSNLSQGSFVIANSDSAINMTPRENEVLYYLLRGGTAKRIGRMLSISSRTVEQYVDVLKDKFGVRTKADLIHRAINLGYLSPVADILGPTCRS